MATGHPGPWPFARSCNGTPAREPGLTTHRCATCGAIFEDGPAALEVIGWGTRATAAAT
jgi:hypothetical protein